MTCKRMQLNEMRSEILGTLSISKKPREMTTVFDVSSLFYDLLNAPVLLKRLYCLS